MEGQKNEGHKTEKNIVFFTPGKAGSSLVMRAGEIVDSQMLEKIKRDLESKTQKNIRYVEERRSLPRFLL